MNRPESAPDPASQKCGCASHVRCRRRLSHGSACGHQWTLRRFWSASCPFPGGNSRAMRTSVFGGADERRTLNSAEVFEQEQENNCTLCLNNNNEQWAPVNNTSIKYPTVRACVRACVRARSKVQRDQDLR